MAPIDSAQKSFYIDIRHFIPGALFFRQNA
jgi:hypothetical protein